MLSIEGGCGWVAGDTEKGSYLAARPSRTSDMSPILGSADINLKKRLPESIVCRLVSAMAATDWGGGGEVL